jgi:hypothetical protein
MNAYQFVILATGLLALGEIPVAPLSSGETISARGVEWSSQNRQRPRIRVTPNQPAAYDYPRPDDYSWPGPGAVRHCVDWYATEYRPSGTVITPQMRCRWVRG